MKKEAIYRFGLGIDVHRFTSKRKNLVLGGVKIEYPLGLEAISDGDVALHAICDGILGAAGLGDIGDYFPPSKRLQGLDSKKIVDFVLKKIKKKWDIVNIDLTLILEKPKLVSYKKKIVTSLTKIFKVKNVNLKVKSKEGLDFLGRKDSITAISLVSLKKC